MGLVGWVFKEGINVGEVVYVFGVVLYEDKGCLFVWEVGCEFESNE